MTGGSFYGWVSGWRDRETGESSWSKHSDYEDGIEALQATVAEAYEAAESRGEKHLLSVFGEAAGRAEDETPIRFRVGNRRYFVVPPEEAALEAQLDGLEHTFETTTFKIALDPDDMGWEL